VSKSDALIEYLAAVGGVHYCDGFRSNADGNEADPIVTHSGLAALVRRGMVRRIEPDRSAYGPHQFVGVPASHRVQWVPPGVVPLPAGFFALLNLRGENLSPWYTIWSPELVAANNAAVLAAVRG
jgi:hypothetical protein